MALNVNERTRDVMKRGADEEEDEVERMEDSQ